MMNKIIGVVLMAVFFSCPLSAADTYTTGDMILTKPGKSSLNWNGKINGNFDIIAASAALKSSSQTLTGQNVFSNKVGILGPVAATYGLAISTTASISGKLTTTVASDILDWTYIGYTSTFFGSQNGAISGDDGFGFYDKSNTWNGRLDLGLIYGPQLHGKGAIGAPLLGLNTSTPKVALDVVGGIVASSSITANGNFYGNGATLTGNLLVGASVQANIFQSADPATVHNIIVSSAIYAVNGGTGGGVVSSTAVVDGSPIGSIIAYSTTTPPSGYLYCDGSYVSTTTYANLFAVTGHRYSTYTVTGTPSVFQLPDLRGMFLRGAFGNLNSSDPDGNRVVGSTQTDTFQGHYHSTDAQKWYGSRRTLSFDSGNQPEINVGFQSASVQAPSTDGTNGTPRTSTETRPENIAVGFMIKYAHVASVNISSTAIINSQDNTWTGKQTLTGSVTMSSLTATGDTSFSNAASTATFSGWIDIGLEIVSTRVNAIQGSISCPSGKKVLGGGCNTNDNTKYLVMSYPSASNGWYCYANAIATLFDIFAICARIK
jgi:microcystin-dependent protein